jgi:endonuclease G|tara:strand:- start:573 stop:1148 length:576 start_codon:yes stop_codon:yes gene_type:complete
MRKIKITLVLILSSIITYSQIIKTDIFTVNYSEKYEQPLWLEYTIQCPNGHAERTGMNFWTPKGIKTSDDADYKDNIYDKGHLAPAAAFNCDKETLLKTFSYLNSALQHEGLNRGQWARLESFERSLANFFEQEVKVRVDVLFEGNLKKVKGGATIPSGFKKTIIMGDITKVFEFPNKNTTGTNWIEYLIK